MGVRPITETLARLQSGGVRLTYIADPESGTTEEMKVFEKFSIGIPVFRDGSAWSLTARLKYRVKSGAATFFYELHRPDRIHQGAAKEMIDIIGKACEVPLLMGVCA